MLRAYLSAICIAVFGLASGFAQAEIISGRITDSMSNPIVGAEVRLKVADDYNSGFDAATTTTDAGGNYSFTVDIDPSLTAIDANYFSSPIEISDRIIIEAGAAGYRPVRIGAGELGCHFFCFYGDIPGPRAGEIALAIGSDTTDLNAQLDQGGHFSGTVTAQNGGAPIANVPINIFVDAGDDLGMRPFEAASTTTDASGNWSTPIGLPIGDMYLMAGNPPRTFQFNDTGFGNYVTMAYGGYECQWGSCVIAATDAVTSAAGVAVSNVDFALPDGAELSGRFYDPGGSLIGGGVAGDPVSGVRLYTPDLGFQIASYFSNDGSYRIVGLSGGNYIAEFIPPGDSHYVRILSDGSHCPFGGCERTEAIPLAIPARATRVYDVFFQEGWKFDVALTDISGLPVNHDASLSIDIIESSTGAIAGGMSAYGSSSAPLSSLTTRYGIPAGNYIVATGSQFRGENGLTGSDFVDAAAPGVDCLGADCRDDASITTYNLSGTPGVVSVTINLDRGYTISGTVTDGTAPVAGRTVTIMNAAGDVLYHGFTADDGSYTSAPLPNGNYRVAVRDGGESAMGYLEGDGLGYLGAKHGGGDCMGQLECLDASGSLISIAGADVSNIDFSLTAAPTITGQVIDTSSGLPVFLKVAVTDASGELIDYYSTYRDGRFTSGGLRPGDYTITPITTRAYSLSSSSSTITKSGKAAASQTVTIGTDNVVLDEPLAVTESLIYKDVFRR